MEPVYHVPFGRVIWSGTFAHIYNHVFLQPVASQINNLWLSSFFWKCSKFNLDFENAGKNPKNVFSFRDNCMWMSCIKLSLLGREHLSTAVIVLTNSLNLFHLTKRDFLPLNCLPVEQQICHRCCRSHLKRVETH